MTFMFNQSKNPRVKDSMNRIANALFDLMRLYPYEEINIRQICSDAQVTRKTFYRNFSTKDDIFDYVIFSRLYYTWDYKEAASLRETLLSFFVYWAKQKEDLALFEKEHIFYLLRDKLQKYVEMNQVISSYIQNQEDIMTFGAYFWSSLLASLLQILEVWASRNFKETPEELTDITMRTINAFKTEPLVQKQV